MSSLAPQYYWNTLIKRHIDLEQVLEADAIGLFSQRQTFNLKSS